MNKEFYALKRAADEIQREFQNDFAYEFKIYDFFYIFCTPIPEYEDLLNAWVESSPAHFAPCLARAHYYVRMAWESRGQDYASETSKEQFAKMRFFFEKALKDLAASIAIDPNLLPAYLALMEIHKAQGERAANVALYLSAKARFPGSFLLYDTMIRASLPRWGGSYSEMEKIAMDGYVHVHDNPGLYCLFGEIYVDQAWNFRKDKNYDEAIALCTKAIGYGDHFRFFQERAQSYSEVKNLDKALEDLDRSIALRPVRADLYRARATVYLNKGEAKRAVEEIAFMEKQFPGEIDPGEWKLRAAQRLVYEGYTVFQTNLEEAAAKFGMAIEVKPDHAEAYLRRGVAYAKLNRSDLAISDLALAIQYNPSDIRPYKSLDYQLSIRGKWDEVIGCWDRFLALEPENGEAYLERAGAHKHKGDKKSAFADLRRACDLGKAEACKILYREAGGGPR